MNYLVFSTRFSSIVPMYFHFSHLLYIRKSMLEKNYELIVHIQTPCAPSEAEKAKGSPVDQGITPIPTCAEESLRVKDMEYRRLHTRAYDPCVRTFQRGIYARLSGHSRVAFGMAYVCCSVRSACLLPRNIHDACSVVKRQVSDSHVCRTWHIHLLRVAAWTTARFAGTSKAR